MSERSQRKAREMFVRMQTYYGNEHHHKHNRSHLLYTEDIDSTNSAGLETVEGHKNWSSKSKLAAKGRKTFTRLGKGSYH